MKIAVMVLSALALAVPFALVARADPPKYVLAAVAAPDKKIERTWKAKCASCHGEDGKGATTKGKEMKVTDMSAAAWQTSKSDDEIREAIRKGTKGTKDGVAQEMDGYADVLAADQLEAIVKYVRWVGAPK